jgi:cbb3-type cytochrome oxidase subunit 3
MFHRILVEEWQRVLTMVSFSIFFITFLVTALRTWRTPRERLQHLASLPLGDDARPHE